MKKLSKAYFHCLIVCLSLFLAQSTWGQANPKTGPAQPVSATSDHKIPFFLDVGFGLGEYEIYDAYDVGGTSTNENVKIYGTQINISAMVERETIHRFKDKIPPEVREHALKLDGFSVSTFWVPKTLYISPRRDHVQAYGATWGIVPSFSSGIGFLKFGLSGGPIITYINFNDDRDTKTIHFIRPGLRGTVFASIPLLTKYVQLEVGGVGDIYVPQKFYSTEKSVWNVKAYYGMIHFLIPIELDNPFKGKN